MLHGRNVQAVHGTGGVVGLCGVKEADQALERLLREWIPGGGAPEGSVRVEVRVCGLVTGEPGRVCGIRPAGKIDEAADEVIPRAESSARIANAYACQPAALPNGMELLIQVSKEIETGLLKR